MISNSLAFKLKNNSDTSFSLVMRIIIALGETMIIIMEIVHGEEIMKAMKVEIISIMMMIEEEAEVEEGEEEVIEVEEVVAEEEEGEEEALIKETIMMVI